jgi:hypothetical protein
MNEKIKELVARDRVKIDVHTGYRFFTRDELEKFAELIVLECAKVADGGWADPGHQIKQHFGVEPTIDDQLRSRSTYFGINP